MKRIIICAILILSMLLSLTGCVKSESYINGVHLKEYSIVYSETDHDYSKRAAEFIKAEVLERTGIELKLIKDSEKAVSEYEIVVGQTSRDISKRLDADTDGLEFAILKEEKQIALEGDYFVIAAAAYYFIETYVPTRNYSAEISDGVSICKPIVKEAKNFILLIGDGMGTYQTLLYDYISNNAEYSDGEDSFYGYMLPYKGSSYTVSLSGITDSAAAGTALATGHKTNNDMLGQLPDGTEVQSLPELALTLGMGAGVMSTEDSTGATPAAFSSHTSSRDNNDDVLDDQFDLQYVKGAQINCGYDQYNLRGIKLLESAITDTLDKLDDKENGFFLMYEEAHIDKHSHAHDMVKTYLALIRFNQAIARFMEYAFYNPDTFILITADHETCGLLPSAGGGLSYTADYHTDMKVPVFAYGDGAELFGDKTIDNTQIAMTIASFMGVNDFGDQSEYTYLGK